MLVDAFNGTRIEISLRRIQDRTSEMRASSNARRGDLHLKENKNSIRETRRHTADGKRVPGVTFVGSLIANKKDFYCILNFLPLRCSRSSIFTANKYCDERSRRNPFERDSIKFLPLSRVRLARLMFNDTIKGKLDYRRRRTLLGGNLHKFRALLSFKRKFPLENFVFFADLNQKLQQTLSACKSHSKLEIYSVSPLETNLN